MRRKVLGFTLIELMIVVAIIAIIAAIAIPGLLRARISANEGSASAGLRSLASAEASFVKANSVDQDNDGSGENGVFNELTGATSLRGIDGSYPCGAVANRPALTTTDLTVALQSLAGSFSAKSGYYFQIFLPGTTAVITDCGTSTLAPETLAEDAGVQQQEQLWICYAWPATFRSSGVRAFVVNQSADVFASANTDTANNGYFFGDVATQRPNYDTAMISNPIAPTTDAWNNISVKDAANAIDTNHNWVPSGG